MSVVNDWFLLNPETLRVDVYRNSVESAVRVTHLPTGLVAECSASKSQTENRKGAIDELTARVFHSLCDFLNYTPHEFTGPSIEGLDTAVLTDE